MRALVPLLVLTLALAAGSASAQTCRVNNYGQVVEYPCPTSGGSSSDESGSDAWAQLDVLLGVAGILLTLGAAGYTYHRVRSRRRDLTSTLAAIERAYTLGKSDPDAGSASLATLRAQVRERHERGKLDDAHFLELDKRASAHLVKLRLLEIDRRFPTLPPLFLAEVRRLLSDGALTHTEADLVEVRAAAYHIPEAPRAQLVALTRQWAGEDEPPTETAPLAAR